MLTEIPESTTDLVLSERGHLLGLARRLTRCEADAEDLVQDTVLRALRAQDRFEPGTSVRAWTTTILRRVHLTGLIRARRRGTCLDTDAGEPLDQVPAERPQPGRLSPPLRELFDHLDDPVKRSLERVPDVYRTPFLMSVVDDFTCSEISACLGVPEGTVMSRIHRARESMKRDLVYERPPAGPPPRSALPHAVAV